MQNSMSEPDRSVSSHAAAERLAGAFSFARRRDAGLLAADPAGYRTALRRTAAVLGVVATLATSLPLAARQPDAPSLSGPAVRLAAAAAPARFGPAGQLGVSSLSPDVARRRGGSAPPPAARRILNEADSSLPSVRDYSDAVYSTAPVGGGVARAFSAIPPIRGLDVVAGHSAPVTHHAVDDPAGFPPDDLTEAVAHAGLGHVRVAPASGAVHVASGGDPASPGTRAMLRRGVITALVHRAMAATPNPTAVPTLEQRAAARRAAPGEPVRNRTAEGVKTAHTVGSIAYQAAGFAPRSRVGRFLYRASRMAHLSGAVVDQGARRPRVPAARPRSSPTLGARVVSRSLVDARAIDVRVAVDLADFAVARLAGRDARAHRATDYADFKEVWNDPARRARVVRAADAAVAHAVSQARGRQPDRESALSPAAGRYLAPAFSAAAPGVERAAEPEVLGYAERQRARQAAARAAGDQSRPSPVREAMSSLAGRPLVPGGGAGADGAAERPARRDSLSTIKSLFRGR